MRGCHCRWKGTSESQGGNHNYGIMEGHVAMEQPIKCDDYQRRQIAGFVLGTVLSPFSGEEGDSHSTVGGGH